MKELARPKSTVAEGVSSRSGSLILGNYSG